MVEMTATLDVSAVVDRLGTVPHATRRPTRGLRYAADVAAALAVAVLTVRTLEVSRPVALLLSVCWVAVLVSTAPADGQPVGGTVRTALRGVLATTAAVGLGAWLTLVLIGRDGLSGVVLAQLALLTFAAALLRVLPWTSGRHLRSRILVVGDREPLSRVVPGLSATPALDVTPVHLRSEVVLAPAPGEYAAVPGVADLARAHAADAVLVLPPPDAAPADMRRLAWQLESTGADLLVGTGLLDVHPGRATAVDLAGVGAVHVRGARRNGLQHRLWQLLNRLVATVAVVFLLPLLLAVAIAVRLDSPGPAIFRQARVGRDGRHFTMYKFRSMRAAAPRNEQLLDLNDTDGVLFKCRQDPRITAVGAVLRKYSIDELPQLFNVILGQMALVGPRPALPSEVAEYHPDVRRRLVVEPGLTGLWQVSGRSDLSWEDTVRLDLAYVDNWSLALDLAILRRTARAVLRHDGAY